MENLTNLRMRLQEVNAIYTEFREILQNHECGFITAREACYQCASLTYKADEKIVCIAEDYNIEVNAVVLMLNLV